MNDDRQLRQEPPPVPPQRPDAAGQLALIFWLSTASVPVALAARIAIILVAPPAGGPVWAAALIGVAWAGVLAWLMTQPALNDGDRAERLIRICVAVPLFGAFGAGVAWLIAGALMTAAGASIGLAVLLGLLVATLVTFLIVKGHGQLAEAMWLCSLLLFVMCLVWPVLEQARTERNRRHHAMTVLAHRQHP